MCNHNDRAIAWHFIEAPHKFSIHSTISDNSPLVVGHRLTKDGYILAIGPGPDCSTSRIWSSLTSCPRPGKTGGYPNFASDVSCVSGCRGDSVARHCSFKTWSRIGVGDRLRDSHLDQDQVSLSSQPPVFPGLPFHSDIMNRTILALSCLHPAKNEAALTHHLE